MAKSGELQEMWDVAAKTNLQLNMVGYRNIYMMTAFIGWYGMLPGWNEISPCLPL